MSPNAANRLLKHSATIYTPVNTVSHGMDVQLTSTASESTSICRIEEPSSMTIMAESRLAGKRVAIGYFPQSATLTKDGKIVVTGRGIPSGGRTYRIVGPARNQAGEGVLQVMDLEAME